MFFERNPTWMRGKHRVGGMPVAYIHTFAYFFFREGKMQFSPRVGCGGLRKGDGKPGAKSNGAPPKTLCAGQGKISRPNWCKVAVTTNANKTSS